MRNERFLEIGKRLQVPPPLYVYVQIVCWGNPVKEHSFIANLIDALIDVLKSTA